MARQIRVDQIDDFFEELVVDLVQATTLEWTRRVKKATPVDTGRLRGAWQTNIKGLKVVSQIMLYMQNLFAFV